MADNGSDTSAELLALDTGGTMTDSFLVDADGNFTVGKAQSTPQNEYKGVINSVEDGLSYWDLTFSESASSLRGIVYSGTAMLNRLLEREGEGENIGVVTNKGFEDMLRFGRGIQSWADLSYSGRLHAREHGHPETIVSPENAFGVTGRINMQGEEIIPFYEDEAREVVHKLLDKDVRIVCVCFLYSYKNPSHEQRFKEIAEEIMQERGEKIPIWLSSDQNPVRGELPRLNTLVLEAYAVEPSRKQLFQIRDSFEDHGVDAPFRVLTVSGGTVAPEHDWLVDTMISGPIGGIFGGRFLSEQLQIENLVCSDVGGTSFDVGLITGGHYPTRWDQSLAQFMMNVPMTAMDSIGSGTGSYVHVDSASGRIEVGPDSAGYLVGVANEDADITTPTITDCSLILGYLNPEFFLGGDIPLNVDAAKEAIKNQLADPIGEDLYATARGVLDIVERDMTNELRALILGMGYSPENYHLVSYGGGGPMHAAGYSQGLDFQEVLIPEWAAAFSAFGCATADYAYRYDRSLDTIINPDLSNASSVVSQLNRTFDDLRQEATEAFERDGIDPNSMLFQPGLRMQYRGMLDDLEINIPIEVWQGELDEEALERIIEIYDEKFGQIFKRAAKSPEQGYVVTMAIGTGIASSASPTFPNEPTHSADPSPDALKETRDIFWKDGWHEADIWDMNGIKPGNELVGPSILEAPATTMVIPPGFKAKLDNHLIYHLKEL